MSANTLLLSVATFKSRTGVSEAIDDAKITPNIKKAQDMYIQTALGSPLFLRLQSGQEASNLNANETLLLDNYITDSLVWYTMSLLPMALGYQLFSKGFLQKTSEESTAPSRADLELIASGYKSDGEFYKQRLINYLRENYSLYQEYFNFTSGLDTIFPELKAYTCPIWLGDSKQEYSNRTFSTNNSAGSLQYIEYTPAAGTTTFVIPGIPTSSVVLIAIRSGQVKGITTSATTNTAYLQIVGSTVTLPTGDITASDELFIFNYR